MVLEEPDCCRFLVLSFQVGLGIGSCACCLTDVLLPVEMTHERQRGSYFNFINVVFVVADAVGPLIGGSFAEKASWRWLFLFNAPFGPFSK